MIVEILSIGDELIEGVTVNTNATFLAQKLARIGVQVRWITAVGDEMDVMVAALRLAFDRAEVVVCTGGLGPTHDDITKKAICNLFDLKLVLNPEILAKIKARFARRGVEMAKVNEEQALIPEGVTVIENHYGTAAGILVSRDQRQMFFLPGVPFEMQHMTDDFVIPFLAEQNRGQYARALIIRTTGVPESTLFQQVGDIATLEKFGRVAFNPGFAGVDIRLTVRGSSEAECQDKLSQARAIVRDKIATAIYGYDSDTMESIIAQKLIAQNRTLATAESCTGGLIANRFTNIPGSSRFFMRGLVTYSNQAKVALLQIPESLLHAHGAVSEPVARLMAANVRELAGVDFGIATTGIAGPDGGTPEKPVGLVFVACADRKNAWVERHVFSTDRIGNKERFAQAALKLFYQKVVLNA